MTVILLKVFLWSRLKSLYENLGHAPSCISFTAPKSALSWMHYVKVWWSQKSSTANITLEFLWFSSTETHQRTIWDLPTVWVRGRSEGERKTQWNYTWGNMTNIVLKTLPLCKTQHENKCRMLYNLTVKLIWGCTFLTINIIRSEVDLNAERLVGIFDGGQGEVGQGFLGKVRHHSLWKKHIIL